MLVADISQAVEDVYTVETIAAPKMLRLIQAAVRFYSRYNPFVVKYPFETVADQEAYDIPAGGIGVIDILWPAEVLDITVNVGQEMAVLALEPARYHFVSDRVISAIQQDAFYKAALGNWRVQNKQVILIPEPGTTGSDVIMWYAQLHAYAADAFATIPDEDLEIIRDLTLAEIALGKSMEAAVQPNYREGLQSETFHYAAESSRVAVKRLQQSCVNKYGGVVVKGA